MLFRVLHHRELLQADPTSLYGRIIAIIGSHIEDQQHDNATLSYWLTNIVTLLFLIHNNTKPAIQHDKPARPVTSAARTIFSSIPTTGTTTLARAESSIHRGGIDAFKLLEVKAPALLFKQQLDSLVQEILPMILSNVKQQITPMLANCFRAPQAVANRAIMKSGTRFGPLGGSGWAMILACFDALLDTLKENGVPKALVQALFAQLFSFVNARLFNQLLQRRECCFFVRVNGEYVKTNLELVERWIAERAGVEHVGDSWNELEHIRQAVAFLVTRAMAHMTLEEIMREICPVLSMQQLQRLMDMSTVSSPEMWALQLEMKGMLSSDSSEARVSLLLDDTSTHPSSAADGVVHDMERKLHEELSVREIIAAMAVLDAAQAKVLEKIKDLEAATPQVPSRAL